MMETNDGALATTEGQEDIHEDNDVEEKETEIDKTTKYPLNEVNVMDLAKDKDYPWWDYTFNAKNKYFIHIQFKAPGGKTWNKLTADWAKYGARYCYINSKPAHIISLHDPRIPACQSKENVYDSNEVITMKHNDKTYKLFYMDRSVGWCFDDGIGIFKNITRTNNGKVDT